MKNSYLSGIPLFLLTFSALFFTPASAAVLFTLDEDEGVVTMVVSGSLDLRSFDGSLGVATNTVTFIAPRSGGIGVGSAVHSEMYSLLPASLTPYGTGFAINLTPQLIAAEGDRVGLFRRSETGERIIGLPSSYESGSELAGNSTFKGDFESLGISHGTFTTQIGSGEFRDFITVMVIPEPSSVSLTCVVATFLCFGLRNRE